MYMYECSPKYMYVHVHLQVEQWELQVPVDTVCMYMYVWIGLIDLIMYVHVHLWGYTVDTRISHAIHERSLRYVRGLYSACTYVYLQVEQWEDCEDFLEKLARKMGRLLKVSTTWGRGGWEKGWVGGWVGGRVNGVDKYVEELWKDGNGRTWGMLEWLSSILYNACVVCIFVVSFIFVMVRSLMLNSHILYMYACTYIRMYSSPSLWFQVCDVDPHTCIYMYTGRSLMGFWWHIQSDIEKCEGWLSPGGHSSGGRALTA